MRRVDLHTHSIASPDGGLQAKHYRRFLEKDRLACVAITDHNTIAFARELEKELGSRIIVGEEIMTTEGEIIGLYLTELIPAGLSPRETVQRIKEQHGLVYIPHPFETRRKGLNAATLAAIAESVDILETINGRALFQNRTTEAQAWAHSHAVVGAASSDAHGFAGWGKTASLLRELPTRENLASLLESAQYQIGSPGLRGVLYPTYNRIRRKGTVHA